MKRGPKQQKNSLRNYALLPLVVSMCSILSACGGSGGLSLTHSVTTGYDDGYSGSLRGVMEYDVTNGDHVVVKPYVHVLDVYGDPITPYAANVTLEGNGSNHIGAMIADITAPALNADANSASSYVQSGWLSTNANRTAYDAQRQGITQMVGGEQGLFYWTDPSSNQLNMEYIHVIGTERIENTNIVGGMIGTVSSSAKIGDMRNTLFTDIAITATGSNSNITGGVIGASSSGRATVDITSNSLFDSIDVYSHRGTINGGAIGVEGENATVGNIEHSQFSNFIINSGNRVIGGAVGAISNGNSNTARVNYIDGALFTNFAVNATDFIVGGAVGIASTGYAEQSGVVNSVFANMGVAGQHITGGAIGLRSDRRSATLNNLNNNYIGHINSYSTGDIIGGAIGLYAGGQTSTEVSASLTGINSSVIDQVYAFATGNIYGGAIGVHANNGTASVGDINYTTMQNNMADSNTSAFGGALSVYTNNGIAQLVAIQNSTFTGNEASSDQNAYGGALYTTGIQNGLTIRNSTFTSNRASSNANAYGGAIFVDTRAYNYGNDHTLTLAADSGGKTLFQNNTLADTSGTRNNAIHFGSITGTSSAENATLNIHPSFNGEVALHDPITVAMNNWKNFTLNMNGAGTFYWDGRNTLNAQGGNRVNLNSGTTILGNNFTVNSSGHALNINAAAGSRLEFMGNRNPTTPMFDFSSASAGSSLNAGSGVSFGVSPRQLTNVNGTFVVARGLTNYSGFSPQSNGSVVSYNTATPGELKVNVNYVSPYRTAIERSANTVQAQYALNNLVSDTTQVSDDNFDNIAHNLPDATAEYGMTQAIAALGTHQAVLSTVNQLAYVDPQRQHLLATALGYQTVQTPTQVASIGALSGLGTLPDTQTLRVWGGYLGDFSRVSSYNNYQGYKTDNDGMVIGTSFDLSPQLNIGAYTAYSGGKTHLRNENTHVSTNSYHFGLTSNYALTPQLNLQADIGGAYYSNEGSRCLGNLCSKGEFNQNLYTLGGQLNYTIQTNDLSVTPFGGLRYTYIRQDGFIEQGGVSSTHVDGFSLNSVSSSFGVSAGRVFTMNRSVIMPEASLAWRHEWADSQASSSSHYTQLPGQNFTIGSYKNDRDYADLSLGLRTMHSLRSGNVLSTYMNYQLGISEHTHNHSLNAGLQLQF